MAFTSDAAARAPRPPSGRHRRLPTTPLAGKKETGKFEKIKQVVSSYNFDCEDDFYLADFQARLEHLRFLRRRIDRYAKGKWKVAGQPLMGHGEEKKRWVKDVLEPVVDREIEGILREAEESERQGGAGLGEEVSPPGAPGRSKGMIAGARTAAGAHASRYGAAGPKWMGGTEHSKRIVLGAASDFDPSPYDESEEEEEALAEEEGFQEGAEAKEEGLPEWLQEDEEEPEALLDPAASKQMRDFSNLESLLEIVQLIEDERQANLAARGEPASTTKAQGREKRKGRIGQAKKVATKAAAEAAGLIGPGAGYLVKGPLAMKALWETRKQRMNLKGAEAGAWAAGETAVAEAIASADRRKKEHLTTKGLSLIPGVTAVQVAYDHWRSSERKGRERERENLAKFILGEARAGDEMAQAAVYTLVKEKKDYIAAMNDELTGYKRVADKLKT